MRKINDISNESKQILSVPLEDGTFFSLSIFYSNIRSAWFIDELIYDDFIVKGIQITTSQNILSKYKFLIGFGIACFNIDNLDPFTIDDFSTNRTELFLLSKEEVDAQ